MGAHVVGGRGTCQQILRWEVGEEPGCIRLGGGNREPLLVLEHYRLSWSALVGGSLEKSSLAWPHQLGGQLGYSLQPHLQPAWLH